MLSVICFLDRSMSCLNLNKLLPARKAWRIFTTKVQSKLHKLNRSKTIKKQKPKKNRLHKTKNNKRISWPGSRNIHRPKRFKPSQTLSYHTNYFQKRASPVYIDQLFIEPVVSVVKAEHPQLLPPIKAADSNKGRKEEEAPSSAKRARNEEMHSADDMWESLVLASPQMNGINERAEEFITRFRAEMRLQERLAARPL